ncbi:MAG: YceI family protein [Acidobacteriota bacterium]
MKSVVNVMVAAAAVVMMMSASPLAQATPAAPVAAANTWTIDGAHSAANFAVKHMMVSTVRGVLGPVTGSIVWDGKNVASVSADVTIDVAKISTGVAQRDAHLRTLDFFAADQFPTMKFKSKKVISGANGAFKLVGDLTIRDVTKEVTLDVEAPAAIVTSQGTQRTATTATTTINRFDYNLKWNQLIEAGGAIVGADVKVTIDLEVTRK